MEEESNQSMISETHLWDYVTFFYKNLFDTKFVETLI